MSFVSKNTGKPSIFCTPWIFITYGFRRIWVKSQGDNISTVKAKHNYWGRSDVGPQELIMSLGSWVTTRVNSNNVDACVKSNRQSQTGRTTLESSRTRTINVDLKLLVPNQSKTQRVKSDPWLLKSRLALMSFVKWDRNSETWLLSPWWMLVTPTKHWLLNRKTLTLESWVQWAPGGERLLLSLV